MNLCDSSQPRTHSEPRPRPNCWFRGSKLAPKPDGQNSCGVTKGRTDQAALGIARTEQYERREVERYWRPGMAEMAMANIPRVSVIVLLGIWRTDFSPNPVFHRTCIYVL